ncbi:MAG: helix-turn-helix domain-containing protein [Microgenomates group bacterium]
MKTVGEIIKEARLKKKITLEEAEKETKIRKKFLLAIEKNDFSLFPSVVIASGFIKNYAQYLGVSPEKALAFFRRDFAVSQKNFLTKEKTTFKKEKKIKFNLSFVLAILIIIFSVGFYLSYQYFVFKKPPPIKLLYPSSLSFETDKKEIEIKGRTRPDAVIKINDLPVLVSLNGEFTFKTELFLGENKFIIEAVDKEGKKTEKILTILRLDKENK